MRQQCREEVKLLVGKEVWEDVKRELRRMRTEQDNSSAEDQTLKKRLRTKHDDVDRNTIQVAVLTASTAQVGPVIAAAIHNPATNVVISQLLPMTTLIPPTTIPLMIHSMDFHVELLLVRTARSLISIHQRLSQS